YFSIELLPEWCACPMRAEVLSPGVYWVRLPGSDFPPDIYQDIPNEVQIAAMLNGIRHLRCERHIGATLSIVDYPFWQPVVSRLSNNVTLYDCMDDYASFKNSGRPARKLESEIVRDADMVICTSEHLRGRIRQYGRDSVLVRNA